MRDKIKSNDYFDSLIFKRYQIIQKTIDKLDNKLIKPERIQSVKKSLFSKFVSIFQAKYSKGDDLNEVIPEDFKMAVQLMDEFWQENHLGVNYSIINGKSQYLNEYTVPLHYNILDLLALSILVDKIDDDSFKKIIAFIDNDEINDFLFEFFIQKKFKDRKTKPKESYSNLNHINKRLGRLKSIIREEDKAKASKELKYFLEKEWYLSFKGTPLYNQHLNPHNTYVGYWCFAAAAIVKIMKLDDSSFRDNQYYPKDLIKKDEV